MVFARSPCSIHVIQSYESIVKDTRHRNNHNQIDFSNVRRKAFHTYNVLFPVRYVVETICGNSPFKNKTLELHLRRSHFLKGANQTLGREVKFLLFLKKYISKSLNFQLHFNEVGPKLSTIFYL